MKKRLFAVVCVLSFGMACCTYASPRDHQRQSEYYDLVDETEPVSSAVEEYQDAVSQATEQSETVVDVSSDRFDELNEAADNASVSISYMTDAADESKKSSGVVSATGTATLPYILDDLSFDVVIRETSCCDASRAVEVAQTTAGKVKSRLMSCGVSPEKIKITKNTSAVSYQYEEAGLSNHFPVKFTATVVLSVKDARIRNLAEYATECIDAGAFEVTNVKAYSRRYEEIYGCALKKACEVAREKARTMAAASGMRLGSCIETEIDSEICVPFIDITSYIDNEIDVTDWTDSMTLVVKSSFEMT